MIDLIILALSEILAVAKLALAQADDPPPEFADFVRRADAELLVLRGRLGGDQDAEDQAEVDAAVPPVATIPALAHDPSAADVPLDPDKPDA